MPIIIKKDLLIKYIADIFHRNGVPQKDAEMSAVVLVTADARGIPSHGVARLWRYVNGIEKGIMLPEVDERVLTETDKTIVLDAKGSLGHPVSYRTMEKVIEKAEVEGMAFASIRDSNHFGIAGFYSMMALKKDMIGISMTNTAALGVPTFARDVMFGTNPISVAVPALNEIPYVLDMSTTAVTRGKVEVYDREEKELPVGWAVNEKGLSAKDPADLLEKMLVRAGGGLLPLGGEGESFGGHKGFGLAVLVDILCAVLSGAPFGPDVADTQETSARVSHFFGAVSLKAFRDPESFKKDMDVMLRQIREAKPAEGQSRVYYAGLKESLNEIESEKSGIELSDKVWNMIKEYADKCGCELEL